MIAVLKPQHQEVWIYGFGCICAALQRKSQSRSPSLLVSFRVRSQVPQTNMRINQSINHQLIADGRERHGNDRDRCSKEDSFDAKSDR